MSGGSEAADLLLARTFRTIQETAGIHFTPAPPPGQCDPYADKELPAAPPELVNELARRYVLLFELITGTKFKFDYSSLLSDAVGVETPDEKIIKDVKKAVAAGFV